MCLQWKWLNEFHWTYVIIWLTINLSMVVCDKHFLNIIFDVHHVAPLWVLGLNCSASCSSLTLNIQLGSEVLLPCTLLKSKKTKEARWSQTSNLLSIRPDGNVSFEDPMDGRMTVFPLLFSRGNFSILIHQFQASDIGVYCCELSHECQRVEIKLSQNPEGHKGGKSWWWIVFSK